jgi:hypothetical protein
MTEPLVDLRLADPASVIPLVRQRVSGPLDSMIKAALVKASIMLCKRSKVVHMERSFANVFAGQTVSFAKASSINRQARQDTREPQVVGSFIHKITSKGEVLSPGEDYHAQSAESIRFLHDFVDVLIVGAIEPLPSATLIPAALVEDYSDVLANGAAFELTAQPNKPWENPNKSAMFEARFNEGVREAYRFRIDQTPSARIINPVRKHRFF